MSRPRFLVVIVNVDVDVDVGVASSCCWCGVTRQPVVALPSSTHPVGFDRYVGGSHPAGDAPVGGGPALQRCGAKRTLCCPHRARGGAHPPLLGRESQVHRSELERLVQPHTLEGRPHLLLVRGDPSARCRSTVPQRIQLGAHEGRGWFAPSQRCACRGC